MRIRTSYSFKAAVGSLDDVATRLVEVNSPAAIITDRTSTFGFVRWKSAAEKVGLRPVYGVELAVTSTMADRSADYCLWTFLAKDDLAPLHKLVGDATRNPGAALSYRQANEAQKDLIVMAGENSILDLTDEAIPIALSPSIPRGQFARAVRDNRTFVATSDNSFPRQEDLELYRVTMGGGARVGTYPQWIMTVGEWFEAMKWIEDKQLLFDAVDLRNLLLSESTAVLGHAEMISPGWPKPLRQLCVEGAAKKGVDLSNDVYSARLERELAMIELKDFEDYFQVIADMVSWAKDRMVVGPARGSSCGSLVCYLIDITAIDPIPYDLLFERFIDITRADLPDIDLDFSDVRREMVFKYIEEKYGRNHVARLGSVSLYKAKSILNQAGVSLRIPQWKIDELSNTVIKRSFGDSRASSTIEDTFVDTEVGRTMMADFPEIRVTTRMENLPHNSGQHAAGVVITQEPVSTFVAVDERTGATMCDKKDAEKLGLLKIDALGLTQLGVFERCLDLIGEKGMSKFLEAIPQEDQAAFQVLRDLKFSGIFQFVPGSASSSLVNELTMVYNGYIDCFEDIVSLTALVRPGPLGSGAASTWIKRRTGSEPVEYFHPSLEPYLKATLGVVIYQEQVMQIGKEIGDLTWDDVTALRKAMSRSLGKEFFDQYGDRWKAGARKRGWNDEEMLATFWDDLCQFGAWAFNRSHSVAYAMVSYWCLLLKAHHPLEFAAATLDAEGDMYSQVTMLKELRDEGIGYVPIDPKLSTDRWQVADGHLIGPLTAIKGIGPAKMRAIMDARATGEELPASLAKMLEGRRTAIDTLSPIEDAVRKLHPDLLAIGIASTPVPIIEAIPGAFRHPIMVIGVVKKVAPLNENEPARVARRNGRMLSGPIEALNMFVRDDSGDEIYCKIDRWNFNRVGRPMLEKCRPGKSIYAIKGEVPVDFRMIKIARVMYLGEIDDDVVTAEVAE